MSPLPWAERGYRGTPLERLLDKIEFVDECWLFRGAHTRAGYGVLRNEGRNIVAHRVAYECMVGPVPDGYQLDHLCSNTPCVNPDHLEAVSPSENITRSYRRRGIVGRRAR